MTSYAMEAKPEHAKIAIRTYVLPLSSLLLAACACRFPLTDEKGLSLRATSRPRPPDADVYDRCKQARDAHYP